MSVIAELHDGRRLEFPDGTDPAVVQRTVQNLLKQGAAPSFGDKIAETGRQFVQQTKDLAGGLVRGAGSIGSTLMAPQDALERALFRSRGVDVGDLNEQRRQGITEATRTLGANPDSMTYGAGKLGAEIGGTLGTGNAIAALAGKIPAVAQAAPNLLQAIATGGMTGGGMIPRVAGGAVAGGAAAGLVNPEDAKLGVLLGGALPAAVKSAGFVGEKIGRGIAPKATPEVAALAKRAQELGIEIPADRLVNSKPLNAVAASLEYVPFSGRSSTVEKMGSGLNRAVSRTFGQESDNVTAALRTASKDLGAQFDDVLKANTVKVTPKFADALAESGNQAVNELGPEGAAIINRQIDVILQKGAAGEIDGQAAYNIKKTLDRIGNRSTPEAFYARDLKAKLMEALNDSLGPEKAKSFSTLRKQYGNMMAVENLAQNGAEGGISAARLANMKNINNADLQELADIAAQFMRTRESPHGALQRLVIGGTAAGAAGGLGMLPILPAAAAAGRGTNALLNSTAARNLITEQSNPLLRAINPDLAQFGYRATPVIGSSR